MSDRVSVFPALGVERELDSVWGDEDCAYIRTCEVADDVECLEIVAETVVFSYRDGVDEAEVIPAVESG